jgi:hypothetical protein
MFAGRKETLPELTPQQVNKLGKLTVVSLAHRFKVKRSGRLMWANGWADFEWFLAGQNIPYDTLMQDLGVSTVREVEDILIDTIYSVRSAVS